jgi:hypothetical protein
MSFTLVNIVPTNKRPVEERQFIQNILTELPNSSARK